MQPCYVIFLIVKKYETGNRSAQALNVQFIKIKLKRKSCPGIDMLSLVRANRERKKFT